MFGAFEDAIAGKPAPTGFVALAKYVNASIL